MTYNRTHQNHMRLSSFTAIFSAAVCLFAAICGCENAPPTQLDLLPASESYVVKDSGLETDWNFSNREFLVQRQSPFLFIQNLDPAQVKQSLARLADMPTYVTRKPDGILDEDYDWLRRYLEPQVELSWISIGDKAELADAAICISNNGDKLATAGKQISIWNAMDGTREANLTAPLANIKQVFWDIKLEHLFLANNDEIVKIETKSGEVTNRWRSPKGSIVCLVKARDDDVFGALIKDGDIVVIDSQLKKQSSLKLDRIYNPNIAISPNGQWVLAATSEGALRWSSDGQGQPPEIRNVFEMTLDTALMCSGSRMDRWIHRHKLFALTEGKLMNVAPMNTQFPLLLGSVIRFAHSASVDGTQDWMVTIGERKDATGKRRLQIQDWNLEDYVSSMPHDLERETVSAASFDGTGERVALKTEKGVELLARHRWTDIDGAMTRQRIVGLFSVGELERFESCAAEIRKLGFKRFHSTGVEQFDVIAKNTGTRWAELLVRDKEKDILKRIEDWAKEKSDLALLASLACTQYLDDARNYPGYYGHTIEMHTRVLTLYEKFKKSYKSNINELLTRTLPTPASFSYALYALDPAKSSFVKDCDAVLLEFVQKWPTCSSPHRVMFDLFLLKEGLNSKESYPYLKLLQQMSASVLPRPNGFVAACLSSRSGEDWWVRDTTVLSPAQQVSVTEAMLADTPVQPWKFEPFLAVGSKQHKVVNPMTGGYTIATGLGKTALLTRMIEAHYYSYELPHSYFYNSSDAPAAYTAFVDANIP